MKPEIVRSGVDESRTKYRILIRYKDGSREMIELDKTKTNFKKELQKYMKLKGVKRHEEKKKKRGVKL